MTAGLLLGAIYSFFTPRNIAVGFLLAFITGIIIYLVAGATGLAVFVQVILIQSLLSKNYKALFSVLPILIIPLVYLQFNFSYTLRLAYLGSFLISKYDELPVIFYSSLVSPLLLLSVFTFLNPFVSRLSQKRAPIFSAAGIVLGFIALVYSSLSSVKEKEMDVLKVLQAGIRDDWKTVLHLSGNMSYLDRLVQFEINRALYRNGQLLDRLSPRILPR